MAGPGVLQRFSPVARAWFEAAFAAPTDAQAQGWESIQEQRVPARPDPGIVLLLVLLMIGCALFADAAVAIVRAPALVAAPVLTLLAVPIMVRPGLGDPLWYLLAAGLFLGVLRIGRRPASGTVVALTGAIVLGGSLVVPTFLPEVQEVPSTKEEGTVVEQNPQEGEQVQRNSKVTISVSGGPSTTEVPDLAGFTLDEARQALQNVGLTVGDTEQVDNTRVEKGNVIESEPSAGSSVEVGTAVTLKVSSGKVEVPDVVGMTRDEAASALSDLGFKNKTTYVESTEPEDTVLKQSIAAGKSADYGSQITLTVARPAPPTPTETPTTETPTPTTEAPPTTTLPLPTTPTPTATSTP